MNLKKLINKNFWIYDKTLYYNLIKYDKQFNASFRSKKALSRDELNSIELRYIKLYRKCQVSKDTIWFRFNFKKLKRLSDKTGIGLYSNLNIGKGLIIGHAGTIVINDNAKFGNNIFLTHGVTIGRDVRGEKKGAPIIGNNVCIRANSTIVGKVNIGNDVLIAPNSFVNFDVPDHSIIVSAKSSIHHRNNATEGHLGVVEED